MEEDKEAITPLHTHQIDDTNIPRIPKPPSQRQHEYPPPLILYPPHNSSPAPNPPPTLTEISSETNNNIDRIIVSNMKIFYQQQRKRVAQRKPVAVKQKMKYLLHVFLDYLKEQKRMKSELQLVLVMHHFTSQ